VQGSESAEITSIDWTLIHKTVRELLGATDALADERQHNPDASPTLAILALSKLRTFMRPWRASHTTGTAQSPDSPLLRLQDAWAALCRITDEFVGDRQPAEPKAEWLNDNQSGAAVVAESGGLAEWFVGKRATIEWAARKIGDAIESVDTNATRTTPCFLGLEIDRDERTVARAAFGKAEFGKKERAWRLFLALVEAGENGQTRAELEATLLRESSPNNLDKWKATCDGIVSQLHIEIATDQRGLWTLAAY
jgi:hypothetical protein